MDKNQFDIKILRLQFFYVTLILVLTIILLVTTNWTKIDGFTDYLTAAGTLVSIVLGILAIIYAFVSGDSISKSLGSVAAAAKELQDARAEFSNIVEAASGLTATSQTSSSQLSELVSEVRAEVQEIKAASSQLNSSTDHVVKAIAQLPARFDKLDIAIEQSMKSQKTENHGSGEKNISTLQNMIETSSSYGKALLYAAALSYETGKPIILHAEPFKMSAEYCYGFLAGADAAYVLNYVLEDVETLAFKIDEFPMSSEEILSHIKATIEDDDDMQKATMTKFVHQLDKYFSVT